MTQDQNQLDVEFTVPVGRYKGQALSVLRDDVEYCRQALTKYEGWLRCLPDFCLDEFVVFIDFLKHVIRKADRPKTPAEIRRRMHKAGWRIVRAA